MNTLIIAFCVFATAIAAPIHIDDDAYELSQFSDPDGSYSFTFATEDSSKTETRIANGRVTGAYSYVDSNGEIQKIQYVGDENGFQVYGTNLPVGSTVPVKETPEVLEATAEHFSLIDEHIKKVAQTARYVEAYRASHPETFTPDIIQKLDHPEFSIPSSNPVVRVVLVPEPVQHEYIPVDNELPEEPQVQRHHTPEHVHQVIHFQTPVSHEEVFIHPEEPIEIIAARKNHLAAVAKITAEHLAAKQGLGF